MSKVLTLIAFAVALVSLAPLPQWYDSPELLLGGTHLGISHPPGQPLFSMLMHCCNWLPIGTPALRYSVFSALLLTATLVALARVLGSQHWLPFLLIACCYVPLQEVARQEVYVGNLALFVAVLWCMERRQLLAGMFLFGLACANHPLLAVTGTLLWLAFGFWELKPKQRPPVLLWGILFLVVGAALYLYLPLRASADPALNFVRPTQWDRFLYVITGKMYSTTSDSHTTLAILWRNLVAVVGIYSKFLSLFGLIAAVWGWFCLFQRKLTAALRWGSVVLLSVLAVLPSTYFTFYETNPDILGYMLPGMLLFFVGGLGAAFDDLLRRFTNAPVRWAAAALLICCLGIQLLRTNVFLRANRHPESDLFAAALTTATPHGAFISFGSYPVYSQLLYAQTIDGLRPDLLLSYRGDPYGSRPYAAVAMHQGVPRPSLVELSLMANAAGEIDLREPEAATRHLVPAGWFFKSQTAAVSAANKIDSEADYAVQKHYWEKAFPATSLWHPGLRVSLETAHLAHAAYYKRLGRETARSQEQRQADALSFVLDQ